MPEAEVTMRNFYVTFGQGTLLRGYYQEFLAKDQCIVAAFCNKRMGGLWSSVYFTKPEGRPLQDAPEALHYEKACHV
jgi:hypothetical protein